jgi:hypothetical protein
LLLRRCGCGWAAAAALRLRLRLLLLLSCCSQLTRAGPCYCSFHFAGSTAGSTRGTDAARRNQARVELTWEKKDGTCVKCFLTLSNTGQTSNSKGNREAFELINESLGFEIEQRSLSFDVTSRQQNVASTRYKGKTFILKTAGIAYSVKTKGEA